MPDDANRIQPLLIQRAEAGADASVISRAVVSTWRAIADAVTPVLGQRGVDALYWRCLHLVADAHPWLGALRQDRAERADLDALTNALARQDTDTAVAGGAALLHTLHELLASLIGLPLTDQLLRHAWTHLSGGSSAQDNIS